MADVVTIWISTLVSIVGFALVMVAFLTGVYFWAIPRRREPKR